MNTTIKIEEALIIISNTTLDVDDKVIASMIETLYIMKDLGFKHISKGDKNDTGQHKPEPL